MTEQEFDDYMHEHKWDVARRAGWKDFIPECDVETFDREIARYDSQIKVRYRKRYLPFSFSGQFSNDSISDCRFGGKRRTSLAILICLVLIAISIKLSSTS